MINHSKEVEREPKNLSCPILDPHLSMYINDDPLHRKDQILLSLYDSLLNILALSRLLQAQPSWPCLTNNFLFPPGHGSW